MNQLKRQPSLPGLTEEDIEQEMFRMRAAMVRAAILRREQKLTLKLRGLRSILPREVFASVKSCIVSSREEYFRELAGSSLEELEDDADIAGHCSEEREAA
jgi:hypothetical protein